ncbi:hypothetical protein GXM_00847 [Nostoc sphaeroides CCNUC1]|uniref:Uncharacterized protein n=1 Tax=Nostoc sphaeroides CCNUC1 TaxID=2653204 RepID=A0A5P8VSS2_9NOSO|nr:hypothetical protein GXM_00847 [Nostoc sphaeroides CCNUC1]
MGVGNTKFKIERLKIYFDFCILNFESYSHSLVETRFIASVPD